MAESSNNPVDALLGLIQSQLLDVNTCLPATIVSYENGIARVSPTGKKRFADGDALDYPIIPNVRICWPSFSGGMAGIKGPVKKGDSCLLVFSQQAVDGSDDRRMFDLQDAYAIMCNIGTAGKSDSINNADMTMYFGPAYIRLTEGGELMINAPGGTTIKTPSTHNTGTLTTDGLLTYKDGMAGTGGGAGTNITGTITQSGGTLSSNGIVLHTHTHGGVQTGGGNTGAPQ
jgi:hypothetical protein